MIALQFAKYVWDVWDEIVGIYVLKGSEYCDD